MRRMIIMLLVLQLAANLLRGGTVNFQEGLDGYSDQVDLCINSSGGIWSSDARLAMDASPRYQSLIRFDHLFGTASNQIPPEAEILRAVIKLKTGSRISSYSGTADDIDIYQVHASWTEASRWGDFSTLGDTVGAKAVSTLIGTYTNTIANDEITPFDITAAVRAWQSGTFTNHGILFVNEGSDGCDFWSDASTNVAERPRLEVEYAIPPVVGAMMASGTLDVFFHAEAGLLYQPQMCSDLLHGEWIDAGAGIIGHDTATSVQLTPTGTVDQALFRLTVAPAP